MLEYIQYLISERNHRDTVKFITTYLGFAMVLTGSENIVLIRDILGENPVFGFIFQIPMLKFILMSLLLSFIASCVKITLEWRSIRISSGKLFNYFMKNKKEKISNLKKTYELAFENGTISDLRRSDADLLREWLTDTLTYAIFGELIIVVTCMINGEFVKIIPVEYPASFYSIILTIGVALVTTLSTSLIINVIYKQRIYREVRDSRVEIDLTLDENFDESPGIE